MPNGNMTDREYLVQIYTEVKNLKEDVKQIKQEGKEDINIVHKRIDKHEKKHQWLLLLIVAIPAAIYYIFEIISKVGK